jgi:hypothetical protein
MLIVEITHCQYDIINTIVEHISEVIKTTYKHETIVRDDRKMVKTFQSQWGYVVINTYKTHNPESDVNEHPIKIYFTGVAAVVVVTDNYTEIKGLSSIGYHLSKPIECIVFNDDPESLETIDKTIIEKSPKYNHDTNHQQTTNPHNSRTYQK